MSEIPPSELIETIIIETLESDEAEGLDSFDLGVLIRKNLDDAKWLRTEDQHYVATHPYKCYKHNCNYLLGLRFATKDQAHRHMVLDHEHRCLRYTRAVVNYHMTCTCGATVYGRGFWDEDDKTNDEYFQEHIDEMAAERERLR